MQFLQYRLLATWVQSSNMVVHLRHSSLAASLLGIGGYHANQIMAVYKKVKTK
jgi:hypothetical protein